MTSETQIKMFHVLDQDIILRKWWQSRWFSRTFLQDMNHLVHGHFFVHRRFRNIRRSRFIVDGFRNSPRYIFVVSITCATRQHYFGRHRRVPTVYLISMSRRHKCRGWGRHGTMYFWREASIDGPCYRYSGVVCGGNCRPVVAGRWSSRAASSYSTSTATFSKRSRRGHVRNRCTYCCRLFLNSTSTRYHSRWIVSIPVSIDGPNQRLSSYHHSLNLKNQLEAWNNFKIMGGEYYKCVWVSNRKFLITIT